MRDQRQAPAGHLNFRSMPYSDAVAQPCTKPRPIKGLGISMTMAVTFCFGKKVLATLKRLRFEPLFFPERFSENIKGHGVACKQVGRQAGVSPIVSFRF